MFKIEVKRYSQKLGFASMLSLIIAIFGFFPVLAVMRSSNYNISTDSLNTGGGDNQNSANYRIQDTVGEISTGASSSANYNLKAGYRQMLETYITISSPSDITLTPSIPGLTGNPGAPASGDATWTVITDNAAGFNLKINATTDPALQLEAGEYFNDYVTANAGTPDYDWTTPAAGSAEFGFSVEAETAADTVQLFLDNGADTCDVSGGSQTNDKCWFGFTGPSDINVINRNSRTDSGGENEKIKFKAESNAKQLKSGDYVATITATAAAN